jgi:MoaA/NifB/PqqE/SkfB family radical SAM enzyme
MYVQMARRLLCETDKRLLWKLAWNMGCKGILSIERHKRRIKRGRFFPPFLYVAVINSCNLCCQGCWMDVTARQQLITPEAFHRLVREAKAMGNVFFGIVGGEPFLHPHLHDMLAEHPDCYFQIFTNGQLITDEQAKWMRRLGNVTPLVSVEGNEIVSDERRGRPGVFGRTMAGLQHCLDNRLFTGVCTSLCRSNIDDLLREAWLDRLIELGVMYTWFHVYRPVGPSPCPELCLSAGQILQARRFVVDMRVRKPIMIVDAYFDGEGRALCPAVNGLSHHIGPWGDVEPCPVIQFAVESIHASASDSRPLPERILHSSFLRDFRALAQATTRGCLLLERPDLLRALVDQHGARDTTARGTARAELRAMQLRTSQYNPGQEIPEKSWMYRLAKWFWFNDFGVYSGLASRERQRPEGVLSGR